MTSAAEHLEDAGQDLDAAVAKIDAALEAGLPAYMQQSGRFVAAEVKVARRRLANLRRLLGSDPKPAG